MKPSHRELENPNVIYESMFKSCENFSNYKIAQGSRKKFCTDCMNGDNIRFINRDKPTDKEK